MWRVPLQVAPIAAAFAVGGTMVGNPVAAEEDSRRTAAEEMAHTLHIENILAEAAAAAALDSMPDGGVLDCLGTRRLDLHCMTF